MLHVVFACVDATIEVAISSTSGDEGTTIEDTICARLVGPTGSAIMREIDFSFTLVPSTAGQYYNYSIHSIYRVYACIYVQRLHACIHVNMIIYIAVKFLKECILLYSYQLYIITFSVQM